MTKESPLYSPAILHRAGFGNTAADPTIPEHPLLMLIDSLSLWQVSVARLGLWELATVCMLVPCQHRWSITARLWKSSIGAHVELESAAVVEAEAEGDEVTYPQSSCQ